MTKDPVSRASIIRLIKKTRTAGRSKAENVNQATTERSLIFEQHAADSVTATSTIEHPFYKRVEFTDDNHVLQTKLIMLDSTDFFVRLHTQTIGDSVTIYEAVGEGEKHILMRMLL